MKSHRAAIAAVLLITLFALGSTPAEAIAPERAQIQYVARFVCGLAPSGEEGQVKPGNYLTSISIDNNTFTSIPFNWRIVSSHRYGESPPGLNSQNFGTLFLLRATLLDCRHVWASLAVAEGTFVTGWIHIGLGNNFILPVKAVYTSQTNNLGSEVEPDAGAGTSIDVEFVPPWVTPSSGAS